MIFIIVAHPDSCWRTRVIFNVSVTATNLKVSSDGNVLIKIYLIWLFVHQLTSYHSHQSYPPYHFNMISYTHNRVATIALLYEKYNTLFSANIA